jgi:hypothetical protein
MLPQVEAFSKAIQKGGKGFFSAFKKRPATASPANRPNTAPANGIGGGSATLTLDEMMTYSNVRLPPHTIISTVGNLPSKQGTQLIAASSKQCSACLLPACQHQRQRDADDGQHDDLPQCALPPLDGQITHTMSATLFVFASNQL